MGKDYDVIIIGSGIGGITCGALLSNAGYKTLVLEKHYLLGGRASSYKKDGCIVDTFIHMVGETERGPLSDILKKIGKPDAIKYWRIDPANRPVLILGGKSYIYPDPSYATEEEIRIAYKGMGMSDKDVDDVVALDQQIYKTSEEECKELDDTPYIEWLQKNSDNEMVMILNASRCLMTGGLGLEEASTGEMMRMIKGWHIEGDVGYPIGGCCVIADTLADIIRENGGDVKSRSSVQEVIIEDGTAVGVKLRNGDEIRSRAVISNAGIKTTINKLAPEGSFTKDYYEYVDNLKYGSFNDEFCANELTLHILLDEPVIKQAWLFAIPTAGFGDQQMDPIDFETASEEEKQKVLSQVGFYMTVTSSMDPSVVPPGKQLVNFDANLFRGFTMKESMEAWVNVLDLIFPGLKEKVLWVDVIKGSAMKAFCGHPKPNVIGLAQKVGQVGDNRPSIDCPVPGLFHVGADVGKGYVGIQLAAKSAINCSEVVSGYLEK
ncbi:MAG: NAD(P)/FAD-dependent oxidoreductase [Desulfobacterales bacterium]|nr:NAD(P)/FAD-dependent oxidoreductase [Desulfobacteraceae bacterium]MBT4365769.1 NAD(P)/FAD-dependent oxidoreductase [Desulfobacteraceae bacterium]MBT7085023.1 NAD(P)/FAD-dependent oxidoreductase [Desulfobacterales bacterium]MBT7698487.1 NAD(P)/FAD-dependent oxidoreductase [Desulfobacterales bacterium]